LPAARRGEKKKKWENLGREGKRKGRETQLAIRVAAGRKRASFSDALRGEKRTEKKKKKKKQEGRAKNFSATFRFDRS